MSLYIASLAEIFKTSSLEVASKGLTIDPAHFDQTRMVENLSHLGVSRFLASNGFSDQVNTLTTIATKKHLASKS
ncbi:MAG: hypothetical protein V9H69_28330 [Anaerolineae bacterium]